jgi:hypothetical protein
MNRHWHATEQCVHEHTPASIENPLGCLLTLGLPNHSALRTPDAALSIGKSFMASSPAHFMQADKYSQPWTGYEHQQPLADGPETTVVWHCSECGDGPYGRWQVSCQTCQHAKCSSCLEEET